MSYREDMILLRRLFINSGADKIGHIDMEEWVALADQLNFEGAILQPK